MAQRDHEHRDPSTSPESQRASGSQFSDLFGFGADLFESDAEIEEFIRGIYERRAESRRRAERDA